MRSRSKNGQRLSASLADGKLTVQQCDACSRIQYPPAEVCRNCLSDQLSWTGELAKGKVVACVAVHRSYADDFAEGGPWWIASVAIDPGVTCYAHAESYLKAGTEVHLVPIVDRLNDGVLGVVTTLDQKPSLQAKFDRRDFIKN